MMRCPRDGYCIEAADHELVCIAGHRYPVVDGIPVMLLNEVDQTLWVADASIEAARRAETEGPYYVDSLGMSHTERAALVEDIKHEKSKIDPVVRFMIAHTSGILYQSLVGNLDTYPIPEIRLPAANGQTLLDIGCNWGRWCVAAGRLGYHPVGIDSSLGAVMAARRVCRDLQINAHFVVGDARFLPFVTGYFDQVFSYSVIQHFSKQNARKALHQIRKVLKQDGASLVQMPNAYGLRSIFHQMKRGFRQPQAFEVRYWSPEEMLKTFRDIIGETNISVDGYFGLGIQKNDLHLLPYKYKLVVQASEVIRRASKLLPFLINFADSLYLQSHAANSPSELPV